MLSVFGIVLLWFQEGLLRGAGSFDRNNDRVSEDMHRQKSKLKISRLTRNLTLNPQRKNSKVFFNWWFKFTRIDHRVESRESTLENVDWKHGDFFSSEADGGEEAVLGNLVLVEQTRKNKGKRCCEIYK